MSDLERYWWSGIHQEVDFSDMRLLMPMSGTEHDDSTEVVI